MPPPKIKIKNQLKFNVVGVAHEKKKRENFTDGAVAGCFYGGAIGDAMGAPVEFSSLQEIQRAYPAGVREPPKTRPIRYTDDTQMTLRVALGLLKSSKEGLLQTYDSCVAEQIVQWVNEDPPRDPGNSCVYGARNLERGVHPSGMPNSKGCGAVMRSAPYGLLLMSEGSAIEMAARHARYTHDHNAAAASAAGLAAVIYAIVDGSNQFQAVDRAVHAARGYDEDTARMVRWAAALAVDKSVDADGVLDVWRGWTGDEALAASVFCWLRNPGSYIDAVSMAVTSPGDSDSLGAITGNMAGAYLGIASIPSEWVDHIENKDQIDQIVEAFCVLLR